MRLVQISDMHIFADKKATLLKLNTWQSCAAVMTLVKAHSKTPDIIILSGDISQDFSTQAYQHVANICKPFTCPIYWLPGNHDSPEIMQEALAKTQLKSDKIIHWQNWTILLLDSHFPGHVSGLLSSTQLAWLDEQLSLYKKQQVLIFLHHHPLAVNSEWLDKSLLQNADAFFAITDQHTHIRGIICGHIHQVFETMRNNIPILSAPSTCIQFLPRSKTFALDKVAPGYRWFDLQTNGTFQTGVERLSQFNNTVDFSAKGY